MGTPWKAVWSLSCAAAALPYVSLAEDITEKDLDLFADAHQGRKEFFDAIQFPPSQKGFSYSHVPPSSITGSHRWPGINDSQLHPAAATLVPTLVDAWVYVQAYLGAAARQRLHHVATAFSYGPICSPLWLTRPWQPHCRRRYGFGAVSRDRSATTNRPTFFHIFYHTWPFLLPNDRRWCQQSSPAILRYSFQRLQAAVTSVASLRAPRPSLSKPPSIDRLCTRLCTRLFSSALLRFDFIHGDLVRWLAGEYTNRHRDWTETFRRLQSPPRLGHPRRLPPPDFPQAQCKATEGVPLTGIFMSHPPELQACVAYNNYSKINDNRDAVEAKFAAEEEKSFHILLPKFFVFFILSLFLNPLQWATRKGKGCICVDCTNGPSAIGSPNHSIPKPSPANADACPPVHYANSFTRFLLLIWSTRQAKPFLDILLHCDDLEAAFRRVLYHPDMAVVFANIFLDFLIIPVGQVFGSRSAPSYFSLLSDIRQEVAPTVALTDNGEALEDLAQSATVDPLPPN